ncbi:hypothetical protein GCM10011609_76840 [Lentzea pudingi]|uniref:Uncharacterized protein n=1 Tax=Lentzea pudingi TaxID=1789439 RepID=A0ABQ2ISN8_9PSEU|nr:hypothetical protein GCM10011609_76840 [Lentzea pudingi]
MPCDNTGLGVVANEDNARKPTFWIPSRAYYTEVDLDQPDDARFLPHLHVNCGENAAGRPTFFPGLVMVARAP